MDEDIYRKIEAYLGGDMTPEEEKQFELMMSRDIALQKEVKLANEINYHLREESWLSIENKDREGAKRDLEDFIESEEAKELKSKLFEAGQRYKKSENKFKVLKIVTSIAAIFIIGLFTTVLLNQKPSTDLYAKYYSENDLPSLVKRGSQNEFLKNGIIAFKAKEYENAIVFFERYIQETKDPLIHSYIGFSYLEMNKINEALASFDKLLNSSSIDNSKALWYKSLVYLKTDKGDELKKVLSEIRSNSSNFNYKKAEEMLQDID